MRALTVTLLVGVSAAHAQPPLDEGESPRPAVPADAPTAKSPAGEAQAREWVESAQRHYDVGRFNEAIALYTRAYEAVPLPALLFNIAQCHRHLGRHAEAAFFYRRYLDLAENPDNEPIARELLAEMETRAQEGRTGANAREALVTTAAGTAASSAPPSPWYRKWWVWAAAGGVVAASATAIVVHNAQPSKTTLGTVNAR